MSPRFQTPTTRALAATQGGADAALAMIEQVLSGPGFDRLDLPCDVAERLGEAYVALLALEDAVEDYLSPASPTA